MIRQRSWSGWETFADFSSFADPADEGCPIENLARIVSPRSPIVGTPWWTPKLSTHPHLDTNSKLAIHLGHESQSLGHPVCD